MDEGLLTKRNEARSAGEIRSYLADQLNRLRVDNHAAFEMLVAAGEAVANACLHGKRRDGDGVIEVSCDRKSADVIVTVSDDGPGFDLSILDFSAPPYPLEDGRRGFFLMRQLSDEVEVETNPGGTRVTLVRQAGRRVDRKAS
jgi:anti-sigma regulatory factor (Ser/Thr protein kinase)